VVLDEAFRWRLVLGGMLTIAGVAAVNHRPAPRPALTPADALDQVDRPAA
jgi:drug/metabolite transporter (DMT)-like permease